MMPKFCHYGEVSLSNYFRFSMSDSEESDYGNFKPRNKKNGEFHALGLSPKSVKAVVRKGYRQPTPIQRKAIPLLLDKRDVVAMARTGSGKTAAFLLPAIDILKEHSVVIGMRCLILSPTRELAIQTMKFAKEFSRGRHLRIALILGGDSMNEQFQALHDNPDIVIATPGRLVHVIHEMNLKLSSVQILICDEADRLFEMGFAEQINEVCSRLPEERQTALFSATLPSSVVEFARAGLRQPTLIRLDVDTKLSEGLKNIHLRVTEGDKWAALLHLLDYVINTKTEQTVVFLPTKHHVEYCVELLKTIELPCCYIYSSLDQAARKINAAKFYTKKVNVLLVTDIAARGIDVPLLDNVINFNFPAKPKLFVHRVGRVARAGKTGTAFSFVAGDELGYLFDLYLFLGKKLNYSLASGPQNGNDCVGNIPQSYLDDQLEQIISLNKVNCLLGSTQKVYKNGYKHYVKSRGAASIESIDRAKQIPTLAAHPIFQSDSMMRRDELLSQLRSYRGKTTIFEVCKSDRSDCQSVMRLKRLLHDKYKCGKKENAGVSEQVNLINTTSSNVGGTFVEVDGPTEVEDVYIPYKKAGNTEAEDRGYSIAENFARDSSNATLELVGDDVDMLRKRKTQVKWDVKKKKFHKVDKENEKMIKSEDGKRIKASYKSGRYKDWMNKTKVNSLNIGDAETNKSMFYAKKRGWHYTKSKSAKSDLKSVDTIIKNRKVKAKHKAQHMKSKGKHRKHK